MKASKRKRKLQTAAARKARSKNKGSTGERHIDIVLPPRISQEPAHEKRISVPPKPVYVPEPVPPSSRRTPKPPPMSSPFYLLMISQLPTGRKRKRSQIEAIAPCIDEVQHLQLKWSVVVAYKGFLSTEPSRAEVYALHLNSFMSRRSGE